MVDLAALVYLLAFGCAFHVSLRYTLTPGASRRPPPRLRRPPPPRPRGPLQETYETHHTLAPRHIQ